MSVSYNTGEHNDQTKLPYDVMTNEELEKYHYDLSEVQEEDNAHTTTQSVNKSAEGEKKMATLAESAKGYESKTTKNIADLPSVSVDLNLEDDEFKFTDKSGEEKTVKQKVVTVDGEKYRVPVSVIQQLQVIIEDKPTLKRFKVKKSGEGKDGTRYTVISIE